jgi:hypothetical protein
MMATATKEEAFELMERSESRRRLIELGRDTAVQMIRAGQDTNTRTLRAQMVADGIYEDVGTDRWLPAVFKSPIFRSIGKCHLAPELYADSNRETGRSAHGGGGLTAANYTLSA